jgi:hypothetical protein
MGGDPVPEKVESQGEHDKALKKIEKEIEKEEVDWMPTMTFRDSSGAASKEDQARAKGAAPKEDNFIPDEFKVAI